MWNTVGASDKYIIWNPSLSRILRNNYYVEHAVGCTQVLSENTRMSYSESTNK